MRLCNLNTMSRTNGEHSTFGHVSWKVVVVLCVVVQTTQVTQIAAKTMKKESLIEQLEF